MKRIIVTDSSSCINRHGDAKPIRIIPFNLHINQHTYQDGIDMTPAQFIESVNGNHGLRLSSSPPAKSYLINLYSKWMRQGVEEIVFVTISSQLSQLNQMINYVADLYRSKIKTHVFDTLTAGVGVGKLATLAQSDIDAGASTETILRRLAYARDSMVTYLTVGDLSYLVANKKLSAPAGILGKLLNRKPMLTIDSCGEITLHAKAQGWGAMIEKMCIGLRDITAGESIRLFTLYPDNAAGDEFAAVVSQHFPGMKIVHSLPSPVIMCHTGPNVFGVGAFVEPMPI